MSSFAEKLDDYLIRYLAYSNYKNYANRLNLEGNERVLEVGCGGGNLSRFLAERLPFGELVCIDNSEYWIRKAKKIRNSANSEFMIKDILDFNQENYFDAVIIHYVLHDITEKEKAVGVLTRSLKPGGTIYVREPTRKNHGMLPEEIEELLFSEDLEQLDSREDYSFPLRGKVYEGIFMKK